MRLFKDAWGPWAGGQWTVRTKGSTTPHGLSLEGTLVMARTWHRIELVTCTAGIICNF